MISFDEAHRLLRYDPLTGRLYWREQRGRAAAGCEAGTINHKGYLTVCVSGRLYTGHRLIWFMVKGEWPDRDIDHKNRNRAENRWTNLRLATRTQNLGNATVHRDNVAGFKGVSWDKSRGKFQAQIQIAGTRKVLGRFDTAEQAHAAYVTAANEHFGEFARSA